MAHALEIALGLIEVYGWPYVVYGLSWLAYRLRLRGFR